MRKVTILGGGGVRTPLLIHGLARARDVLGVTQVSLFDRDAARTETIASIGREIARRLDGGFEISVDTSLESAAAGADFVLNSVRVGGIKARARDERLAIDHMLAGQETTGPGGAAMALRTVPVTLAHARVVEQVAPKAWFINFTNPAGLITQALTQSTRLRVLGICDTPSELFYRISEALREPLGDFDFEYAGLNHLGWIRRVVLRGVDITPRLLSDDAVLRRFYPADLFDPALIRTLGLIPTEYLFFYYSQQRAYRNQLRAGASRGEELERLNAGLFERLATRDAAAALDAYSSYLVQRSGSYMQLEAAGGTVFSEFAAYDPFDTATGYHRIALDVMVGVVSDNPKRVVLNVPNRGAIPGLRDDDVVEVPCDVSRNGAELRHSGELPESVRGLVYSVKQYERTLIRAALERSADLARLALMECPIIGQWEVAGSVLSKLITSDPEYLGYLS